MLQNKSMLVELSISQWTATKHDKTVSIEVENAHGAHDAGRYNKRLIDKAHLASIAKVAGELRKYHYGRTLPWTDKGQRLLPSALFMEYRQGVSDLKNKFNLAVDGFAKLYPQLVQDARQRLGSMYQPEDYPQPWEVSDMFGIHVEFMPVPDAENFRVSVAKEDLDEIKANITASIAQRQSKAVQDCHGRVREVVGRIAEQCGREDGRIHDSLIGSASDLASILHGLNITSDPLLTELETDLKDLIVPVGVLRTSPTARRRVADKALALLSKIPA